MRTRRPEDTTFSRLVLDVEQGHCHHCGSRLHICDHRIRRIYTLEGPRELCCRLAHCSDPTCSHRCHPRSPKAELALALPGWILGWDVFCFLGHRRFARHWSVPQIRAELHDVSNIALSLVAICNYVRRSRTRVAARRQDRQQLTAAYPGIDSLVLTIAGLQPENGHETLSTVREVNAKRVWFAEALRSSSTDEVCPLLVRARQIAESLGKPVRLGSSDKRDAFVQGIARVFPDLPHRSCVQHFLRDLAKPMLPAESRAKVQMRKKVRGLRALARDALSQRRESSTQETLTKGLATNEGVGAEARQRGCGPVQSPSGQTGARNQSEQGPSGVLATKDSVAQVVLDSCAVVRSILNDAQGGPLRPPGMRRAEALREVRASWQRNLDLNQPGPGHGQLARLAGCLDRGLEAVNEAQERIKKQVEQVKAVAETVKEENGPRWRRQARYGKLQRDYEKQGEEFPAHLAKVRRSFAKGMFVKVRVKKGEQLPIDNDELERWFRKPQSHARRVHGRKPAGVRIVQEGPTLLPTLNSHETHPKPFTAPERFSFWQAEEPENQREAIQRRKIMRKAKSKKSDPDNSRS